MPLRYGVPQLRQPATVTCQACSLRSCYPSRFSCSPRLFLGLLIHDFCNVEGGHINAGFCEFAATLEVVPNHLPCCKICPRLLPNVAANCAAIAPRTTGIIPKGECS